MHHLAIMTPRWKFIPQILSAQKTIESRWYLTRRAPWGKTSPNISIGDLIYFQNSGQPVTASAEVAQVIAHSNLTPALADQILQKYSRQIGVTPDILSTIRPQLLRKKYCLLIFLKNPRPVTPFRINKKGFGQSAAWLTVKNIEDIKI